MKQTKSVCAFPFRVVEARIEYLMLHRVPKKGGFWQGVTGKIEKGELPAAAASRETLEETGLHPLEVITVDYVHVYYHANSEKVRREPTFGVRVGDAFVALSKEHDEYRWTTFEEALSLLRWVGNKRGLEALQAILCR